MPTQCEEHGKRLARIEEGMGDGKVTFNTLSLQLEQIHVQTVKTNGRVTALEGAAVQAKIAAARGAYGYKQMARDLVIIGAVAGVLLTVASRLIDVYAVRNAPPVLAADPIE